MNTPRKDDDEAEPSPPPSDAEQVESSGRSGLVEGMGEDEPGESEAAPKNVPDKRSRP